MLIQNPDARLSHSLNGQWDIIIDPYQGGYYNHRYEENPRGYFLNQKPNAISDLIEYDFASSQKLTVPGDWNTQDDRLFFLREPFGIIESLSRKKYRISDTSSTLGQLITMQLSM